jgi:hypothetical protein
MSDSSNDISNQIDDMVIEPCLEINEFEEVGARLGFNGLLKDAPRNVSTSIVNALSHHSRNR